MKKIKCIEYLNSGVEVVLEINLSDLLLKIPYLISKKTLLIPPVSVLQDTLKLGEVDAGMSGMIEWSSSSIDAGTISEAVQFLVNQGYEKSETPEWVKDRISWSAWKANKLNGIPIKEHIEFLQKIEHLEKKINSIDDSSRLKFLKIEKFEIEQEFSNFLNQIGQEN